MRATDGRGLTSSAAPAPASAARPGRRPGPLEAVHDDHVLGLEPLLDRHQRPQHRRLRGVLRGVLEGPCRGRGVRRRRRGAEELGADRDRPLGDLVLRPDDVDVPPLLSGHQRLLGDHRLRGGVAGRHPHPGVQPGVEEPDLARADLRVRHPAADADGAGPHVHLVLAEVDHPGVRVAVLAGHADRQRNLGVRGDRHLLVHQRPLVLDQIALRGVEQDVQLVHLHDRGQERRVGLADEVPLVHVRPADEAADRGADVGVAEEDAGRVEGGVGGVAGGLGGELLGLVHFQRRLGLVELGLGCRVAGPLEPLDLGRRQLDLGGPVMDVGGRLGQLGLGLPLGRFELPLLDGVQLLPLEPAPEQPSLERRPLDLHPLGEVHAGQNSLHPGADLDRLRGFERAVVLVVGLHRHHGRLQHPDLRRRRRRRYFLLLVAPHGPAREWGE